MAKILITGGTGFVGSHLVEKLLANGEQDIHVTTHSLKESYVSQILPIKNIHSLDLAKVEQVEGLLNELQPEQIYHLASLSKVADSFEKIQIILQSNLQIQLNLLEMVKKHLPQARILTVGSALAYKSSSQALNETAVLGPDNPYALSKVIQDLLSYTMSQTANLDIVRALPFNHIGERQAPGFVVTDFAMQVAAIEAGKQDKIKVGNLETIRDFTDVKDVVDAYILLMKQGVKGEAYNIGSGVGIKIQDILNYLLSLAKTQIEIETDLSRIRPVDLKYLVCDNGKIAKLGWQKRIEIKDTLARILDWWREEVKKQK